MLFRSGAERQRVNAWDHRCDFNVSRLRWVQVRRRMRFRATIENVDTFVSAYLQLMTWIATHTYPQKSYSQLTNCRRSASSSLESTKCASSALETLMKAVSRFGRKQSHR